jgi:UTP--glucose-1-phosphate uridylyltransferase
MKGIVDKCLFPVAGYGTRFLPVTKAMPKEMLPVFNKPLIQYGVKEAADAGMREIAFVTGRNKRSIEDHFDRSPEIEEAVIGSDSERQLHEINCLIKECTFSYTRQHHALGLGHAILTGETLIGTDAFGVILADDLCIGDGMGVMGQMLEVFQQTGKCVVGLEKVAWEDTQRYGIVEGEEIDQRLVLIRGMVEKPTPGSARSNLAIIGRYILTPDVFDILRKVKPGTRKEIQLTDALQIKAEKGEVIGLQYVGKRFDCGTFDGFFAANNYVYTHKGISKSIDGVRL